MADLLPALSSDEENGKFDDEDDDDDDDEGMELEFGGLLVSRLSNRISLQNVFQKR